MNPAQAGIDKLWALEVEKRVADVEAGKVRPARFGLFLARRSLKNEERTQSVKFAVHPDTEHDLR